MANLNGQTILNALEILDRPATFHEIVVCIADTTGVPPDVVKESIQETLNAGVNYGFIELENRRYSAIRIPAAIVANLEEAKKAEAEAEKNGEEKKGNNENDELEEIKQTEKGWKEEEGCR